jgi:hypothetical protein
MNQRGAQKGQHKQTFSVSDSVLVVNKHILTMSVRFVPFIMRIRYGVND